MTSAGGTGPRLLTISAATPEELERETDRLAEQLDSLAAGRGTGPDGPDGPDGSDGLSGLSRRLRQRQALEHRRALVTTDPARAAHHLRERDPRQLVTARADPDRPVVFLAAGVGDHYLGMTAGLQHQLPVYAAHLRTCLRELDRELGGDLGAFLSRVAADSAGARRVGVPAGPADGAAGPAIDDTEVAQPAVFAVQYAMAATLQSLGVRPTALLGYSLGEYVAACLAGILPLDQAATLVARRARLVSELPAGGGMLAVMAGAEAVTPHLVTGRVALAALNGPELTVLSGYSTDLDRVAERLVGRGIACQPMAARHAFHSPLMAPVTARLRELVAGFRLRPPHVPVLSNGSGAWMGEEATGPDYWADQLCGTVRFTDDLAELWRLKSPVLVELGPGQGLIRLAMRSPDRPAEHGSVAVPTLPGPLERRPDTVVFLDAVARLWAAGTGVDLGGVT
ncbi:acyltransferase domain-containing protein [Kitasatospora sp. NPDC089509]|uniref:acyltransferase domain-containing protein n=1 Tax=Kitasatospora sp. NPDC089509 TaxID=3364079 RepID=UPI0038303ABE